MGHRLFRCPMLRKPLSNTWILDALDAAGGPLAFDEISARAPTNNDAQALSFTLRQLVRDGFIERAHTTQGIVYQRTTKPQDLATQERQQQQQILEILHALNDSETPLTLVELLDRMPSGNRRVTGRLLQDLSRRNLIEQVSTHTRTAHWRINDEGRQAARAATPPA